MSLIQIYSEAVRLGALQADFAQEAALPELERLRLQLQQPTQTRMVSQTCACTPWDLSLGRGRARQIYVDGYIRP